MSITLESARIWLLVGKNKQTNTEKTKFEAVMWESWPANELLFIWGQVERICKRR